MHQCVRTGYIRTQTSTKTDLLVQKTISTNKTSWTLFNLNHKNPPHKKIRRKDKRFSDRFFFMFKCVSQAFIPKSFTRFSTLSKFHSTLILSLSLSYFRSPSCHFSNKAHNLIPNQSPKWTFLEILALPEKLTSVPFYIVVTAVSRWNFRCGNWPVNNYRKINEQINNVISQ